MFQGAQPGREGHFVPRQACLVPILCFKWLTAFVGDIEPGRGTNLSLRAPIATVQAIANTALGRIVGGQAIAMKRLGTYEHYREIADHKRAHNPSP